jgi:hypothetical protein
MSKQGVALLVVLILVIAGVALAYFDVDVEGGKLPDVQMSVNQTEETQLPKFDVVKTQEGNLPKFDVEADAQGGKLPEVSVEAPEVDVQTKTVEVEVPTDVEVSDADENETR